MLIVLALNRLFAKAPMPFLPKKSTLLGSYCIVLSLYLKFDKSNTKL